MSRQKKRTKVTDDLIKPGPKCDTGGLTVGSLSVEQRAVYDAIMLNH